MGVFIYPEPQLETIPLDRLLIRTMEMKKGGMRVGQICAAYVDGKYELSYTFVNDGNYRMITLRVIVELDEQVPSITEIYPYVTFYENEIHEMFGVNVNLINRDYHDRLYRIDDEMPFLPEQAREKKHEMEAEDARRAAEAAAAGKEEA